jgi:effector-binding domain-containing protein
VISEPRVVDFNARSYWGIRVQVPMAELPIVIPRLIGEVHGALQQRDVRPAGAPFVRYHAINMTGKMDIEVGWPVGSEATGNGSVTAGALPAGKYATLVYTGNYPGLIDATAALLKWGAEQGLRWDSWPVGEGEAFGARLESYWTNPAEEPDLNKHETEIAIRLADDRSG